MRLPLSQLRPLHIALATMAYWLAVGPIWRQ